MNYYNDDSNEDLNEILPAGMDALIGTNVNQDAPCHFDVLKSSEFEEVVTYINAHYRIACNEKTQKTGTHGNFSSYCHGKKWLIYYHALLNEEGNSDLNCFAFPSLPPPYLAATYDFPFCGKTHCALNCGTL